MKKVLFDFVGKFAILAVVGCGSKYVPVSGTVTYKGNPVPTGTVSLFPASNESGQVATGTIKNGRYSIGTTNVGDGAKAGKYYVTVQSMEMFQMPIAPDALGTGGGAIPMQDMELARKLKKEGKFTGPKHLVPEKYSQKETSQLELEVGSSAVNFDIELTD